MDNPWNCTTILRKECSGELFNEITFATKSFVKPIYGGFDGLCFPVTRPPNQQEYSRRGRYTSHKLLCPRFESGQEICAEDILVGSPAILIKKASDPP